ncbi:conserved hypothetical protein [Methanolacinia petrolearia DSM 11571]|uniref:Phage-Barnase-EndoU-ColicinE5/D-RelE like nuclease 3 domain-containing protein n=1 Tax=Methanolacinia petrolearia (strain DSM 11571 / OCM 486 / SEBR 4847) TaxID=679926 RepID=E1RD94_METP4|nr:hypothetical protein [Methanolacinia petrolearia]ADN37077.1 conserved hypothetical protein [Methanolacinia petrolearia DSM 11571]
MNLSTFLQLLPKLKPENIKSSKHFAIRHEERKDKTIPDIEGIHQMLISGEPVSVSKQDNEKFEIMFNLNENHDLVMVVAVKSTNPEIIINLITCYKKEINRRMK